MVDGWFYSRFADYIIWFGFSDSMDDRLDSSAQTSTRRDIVLLCWGGDFESSYWPRLGLAENPLRWPETLDAVDV